jgi:glycosyltransferase involved in cell wall biosynthesis
MRRAIQKASAIVIGWHHRLWVPGFKLVRRLGMEDKIVRLPLGIDTGRFVVEKKSVSTLRAELLPGSSDTELVIFHPTRQAFTSNYTATKKGNDRLYRALARLKAIGRSFTLIIVKKGNPDEVTAQRLIRQLGIAEHVIWVPMMPRHELIRWYQLADLTADHFMVGALGSIPLESMACGTPVMAFLQTQADDDIFLEPTGLFPELPPIINASSEKEIFEALSWYAAHRSELEQLGEQSRVWVMNNVAGEIVAQRYLALYEHILEKT